MKINNILNFIPINKVNIKYVLIIVFLYLFFLLINIPANLVLSTFKLPNNISLSSITGTIWSGKVNRFKYSGIDLGSMSWELHPLSLIIGNLSADISIINNKQYINTEISLSSSGKLDLEETRFRIDLSSLQPLTYGMPFSYSGNASGYFPTSFFHKNQFIGINGKLSLSAIEMITPQRQLFGDFVVEFQAEKEGASSGKIKDVAGELSVNGKLMMKKNGQLNVSAKLSARKKDSPLEKVLSFLGSKDASGRVQLNNNFNLWR